MAFTGIFQYLNYIWILYKETTGEGISKQEFLF